MISFRCLHVILVAMLVFTIEPRGNAQVSNDLEAQLQTLKGRVLRLREPALGDVLKYSADGTRVEGKPGLRGPDDYIKVKAAAFAGRELVISGERAFLSFDSKKQAETYLVNEGDQITVRLDLGPATLTSQELAKTFFLVFRRADEISASNCTEEERAEGIRVLSTGSKTNEHKKKRDSKTACFPNGSKAFLVGDGITPLKAVNTPDPEYTEGARRRNVRGFVHFAARIDETGSLTDVILLKTNDVEIPYMAIRTLRHWRFNPAKRDGSSVAVVCKIEMNFRNE